MNKRARVILAILAGCIFITGVVGLVFSLQDNSWRCPECGKRNMFPFCTRCGVGKTPNIYTFPWKMNLPDSFDKIEETQDSVLYYDKKNEMEIYIRWENCATGYIGDQLSHRYHEEISRHESVTYKALKDRAFEVSGYDYDKEYIYYMHGQTGGTTLCLMYFYYPTANRTYCDRTVECVRDSLEVF